jgi:PAS domain S-box-containing protein
MKAKLPTKSAKPRAGIAARRKAPHGLRERQQELTAEQVDTVLLESRDRPQESEERLRALFATAATGIAVITPDGRYLYANAAYCRVLGYTRKELLALNFAAVTHPDDLKANLKLKHELLAGERENYYLEKRCLTKSGDIVCVRHGVSATRTAEGDITSLLVISEDIAERKLAEDALRHSEERLRLITNLVPHGIFAKDAAGRHIFANPALAEFAGLPIEEILGKDDFELVPDRAQAEAYRAHDLAVIRSGSKLVIHEEPRTDHSGRTRYLQTIKIPFTLAQTGEQAVLGVCMDITERKRTDARFRRLVDSNVQGVFFWNTNGQTTSANDAFLRMVGYSREDLDAGRISWAAMTPPEWVEQDRRALQELAINGMCDPFEKEFIRRDGSRVPVVVGPANFEDNRDEGFCFVLDLSERKQLEQQFLRSQRMESIGTLAGGIAHDLNNILATILLSVDLLKRESGTPKSREILKVIGISAQRGADVVGQVLAFARGLESRRVEVQPKLILEELESIIKDTFPRNIDLQFRVPDDTWPVFGDPTQVHQILLNLCVNARDAMPNGGRLVISTENQTLDEQRVKRTEFRATAGRYVCISVADSGIGIPQEIIHRIFEPFFTTKEPNQGTGLGLSTVMAIVKSHEGIADVFSEPGKGTAFKVYLPAIDRSSVGQWQETPAIELPRGSGETILVVDDESSILAVTRQTLEDFGYRVLTAADGAEAVALYAADRDGIAMVLTDMRMPILDGTSLIRVLQRINPAVRIVTSSGFSSTASRSNLAPGEIKHFLAKPYTAETLLRTLHTVLEEA